MKDHYDPWYIRMPDGRTIKAKSTASVRHHIEAGHIPLNSMVRRDSGEEWVNLVWVAEFADLGARAGGQPPTPSSSGGQPTTRSGVAARLDPMRLQTVGVRGLIDELIAALDTTLTRSKMVPAFVAAILIFLGFYAARAAHHLVFDPKDMPALPVVAGSAFALVVLSLLNALLAKLTHLELSTMRPARLSDATGTFVGYAVQVLLANAIIAGAGLALLFLMNHVSESADKWLADYSGMNERVREILMALALIVLSLLSVLVWLMVGLCWLIAPAIVVEESSWLAGVREWRQLVREHFGRIVVYEGLTIMLGIAISLPLTLTVNLALRGEPTIMPGWPVSTGNVENWIKGGAHAAIKGLTAGPLLALLAVANVFIYLNLRYEQSPGK